VSGLLPTSTAAQIAGVVVTSFTQTATRTIGGTNTTGQTSGGWVAATSAGATYPCRMTPLTREAAEGLVSAELVSRVYYWLTYPLGTALTAQDTVTVDGRTYAVQAVMDPSGYAVMRRALVWRDSE
jgi:hypothetical protein